MSAQLTEAELLAGAQSLARNSEGGSWRELERWQQKMYLRWMREAIEAANRAEPAPANTDAPAAPDSLVWTEALA